MAKTASSIKKRGRPRKTEAEENTKKVAVKSKAGKKSTAAKGKKTVASKAVSKKAAAKKTVKSAKSAAARVTKVTATAKTKKKPGRPAKAKATAVTPKKTRRTAAKPAVKAKTGRPVAKVAKPDILEIVVDISKPKAAVDKVEKRLSQATAELQKARLNLKTKTQKANRTGTKGDLRSMGAARKVVDKNKLQIAALKEKLVGAKLVLKRAVAMEKVQAMAEQGQQKLKLKREKQLKTEIRKIAARAEKFEKRLLKKVDKAVEKSMKGPKKKLNKKLMAAIAKAEKVGVPKKKRGRKPSSS